MGCLLTPLPCRFVWCPGGMWAVLSEGWQVRTRRFAGDCLDQPGYELAEVASVAGVACVMESSYG